jgi:hypothetical protein
MRRRAKPRPSKAGPNPDRVGIALGHYRLCNPAFERWQCNIWREEIMKSSSVIAGFLMLVVVVYSAGVPMKEINRSKVLSAGPEWQQNYDNYNPAAGQITALNEKLGENLRIDIYLGLWCSDSLNNVPAFLKILDLTGTTVPVRLFSVHRKPVKTIQYFVDTFQVERVPTFIFYRGDREIGRIVENPKAGLINDMIEILSK